MSKIGTRFAGGAAIVLALLASGCGEKSAERTAAKSGDEAKPTLQVGLVFDVGGKGDKSFNDSAFEGATRAVNELGVRLTDFEPGQDADRETGLRKLAGRGYDMVIGVGFLFTDAIRVVAAEYPDVKFVLVDGRIDDLDNVVSLVFREQEGSYLVGALAGLTSETGVIGFVGGMDVPLIHRFEAGYRAGATHVRPDIRVLVGYAGVRPEAFADPVRGKEITLSQIARDADVIYHAAGVTGLGVIEAAREQGKYSIGVDANQNGVAPGSVLTSMVKRVDVAIFTTIQEVAAGTFRGGLREFGLAENGVGWALDENNEALVPRERREYLAALADSIVAGEIDVPADAGRR
ncbi:MAG: BMP family ABC transporter substrate-binding protein [bacterium]